MTTTLACAVFPGGFNLPLWTAMEEGCLKRRGLTVEPYYVSASTEQLPGLIDGRFEIGLTGLDNIVAYNAGQGEAETENKPDLTAFMGGDDAFLRLVTRADIKDFADLKGQQLAVDAMTTGFAFVLRKMVEQAGLGDDVEYVKAGGVMHRWEGLKEGRFAGTLLITPFELIGQKLGLNLLQSGSDIFPHYQGIVGVTRRQWAADNGDTLTAFIAAYLEALAWLFAPANRKAAEQRLCAHVPAMTPQMAALACDVLLAPEGGFEPRARFDVEGIRTVLALRAEYGEPKRALGKAEDYFDETWYKRALQDG